LDVISVGCKWDRFKSVSGYTGTRCTLHCMFMFSTNLRDEVHEFPAHGMNAHERMVVHTYMYTHTHTHTHTHILTSALLAFEWSVEPPGDRAQGTDSIRDGGSATAGQCREHKTLSLCPESKHKPSNIQPVA